MKVVFLLVVVLTAMFTANCRDQVNNFEDQLFPDEPGEDYIFPGGQVDNAFIGEAQHVSMGSGNQNIGEEDQQMNNNFDMGSVSDQRALMNERGKKCTPSPLCTHAGGHCVKKKGDCNGLIDRNGCKGNKKCQCCIPDDIICGPAPTTVVPTTTMGSTLSPNLKWLTVGADRFVKYNQTMTWTDARAVCRSEGLDLYQPRDILAISKYLDENYFNGSSNIFFWLGGKGNGTNQLWFSGSVVPSNAPWWGSYASNVDTNHCMLFFAYGGNADKGTVLAAYNCLDTTQMRPLCG